MWDVQWSVFLAAGLELKGPAVNVQMLTQVNFARVSLRTLAQGCRLHRR